MQEPTMQDSGGRRQFGTGAVRDRGDFKPRPDLISPHANLREGAWLEKGAKKYKPRNWEAGMPISECVASLARHLEAYKLGKTDEDHMAAIRTNAGFILHYEEEIKAGRLPASLDDMPHYATRSRSLEQARADCMTDETLTKIAKKLDDTFGSGAPVKSIIADDFHASVSECYTHEGGVTPVDQLYQYTTKAHFDPNIIPDETPPPRKPFAVYLCGPITGNSIDSAWRQFVTKQLGKAGIVTLDPLRGKDLREISNKGMSYHNELASTEMADRDRLDVEKADLILAHFPYTPPRQSIGSLMEMGGAAIGLKKPIVLCTNLKEFCDHLFTRKFCIIVSDLTQALNTIKEIAHGSRR